VPVDETNLIVRAGRALDKNRGANVSLQKKIPMGGGLGGGSSNAAFALIGLNKLWNLNLPVSRLAEIGAGLGSDVPFFLHGPSSVCTGRGEKVKPIPPPLPKYAVLIFPVMSVSTPAVYRRFDEMKLGSSDAIREDVEFGRWSRLPAKELLGRLVNDLDAPSFSVCPELGMMRESLEQEIGRIVRMSGSGSTLFTLADEKEEAESLALQIQRNGVPAHPYEVGRGISGLP
jgi:4-diphosphocytidyl-2-C-methyl-D-erythritol kinase